MTSLVLKVKKAKKNNDDLKKAEKRAIELMDTVSGLNKKVSKLENSNKSLCLMKDQDKEIIEKTEKARSKSTSDAITTNNKKKCKFENTGNCRNRECEDIHPKKTCQSSSKLGSCPLESSCEHRHPFGRMDTVSGVMVVGTVIPLKWALRGLPMPNLF